MLADFSALSDKDDVAFAQWLAQEIGVATVPGSSFYHAGEERGKTHDALRVLQEARDARAGGGAAGRIWRAV